jgi:hypothetical protein
MRLDKLVVVALVCLTGAAAQANTKRMPLWESQAIKQSMLPPGGRMQDYELDHCIPLCLDGSNDRSNLMLQLWADANRKDDDERRLCRMVKSRQLSREQAIDYLRRNWGCR